MAMTPEFKRLLVIVLVLAVMTLGLNFFTLA